MSYREVTMIEVKEVLRLWMKGQAKKRIAAQLGLDPKTVRRYLRAAQECGVEAGGTRELTEEQVGAVMVLLRGVSARPYGAAWETCVAQRGFIERHLQSGVRLSKVCRLLKRSGVPVPYGTLYRYAVSELSFGRAAATMPVADGKPGEEVQVDTGWMTMLEPDERGRRRKFRAWIFTPGVSRYRFVWPCFAETTKSAIEACEEAWAFYGGIFRVMIPDNTKAIVQEADPLAARINVVFLEYAQARGFVIDPTRAGKPKDKARVEKSVRDVRDDCFGGERLLDLGGARARARHWCVAEYGMRRHGTTRRLPSEHFAADELPVLLPAPEGRYDVPVWATPKVARDQHASVAGALYSLPTRYVGARLRARADSRLVQFYDAKALVKTHPRMPQGLRATDRNDFPVERTAYALRDVAYLERQADGNGELVGRYARALLNVPLPWTRMRRVYALLRACQRYGAERVNEACGRALAVDLVDMRRLERMLKAAQTAQEGTLMTKPPAARYLRPADDYALPGLTVQGMNQGGEK